MRKEALEMATVNVNSFSLTLLSGNRVRVDVQFNVNQTSTEARLGIPSHVWVRLMERDSDRDATHLFSDWVSHRPFGTNDDPATGWMYAGLFSSSTTGNFSRTLNRGNLPGESGNEEWYCVLASRPDLVSDIGYSSEISANLA